MLSPPNNSNLWPPKHQAATQFIHQATERLTDLEQGHNTSRFMFDKHTVYRYICRISNALSILIEIISTQLLFYYKHTVYTYICRISNALSILIEIISTQLLFYYKHTVYRYICRITNALSILIKIISTQYYCVVGIYPNQQFLQWSKLVTGCINLLLGDCC